jgi:hypothetical protein
MTADPLPLKPRLYGWWVVPASFAVMFVEPVAARRFRSELRSFLRRVRGDPSLAGDGFFGGRSVIGIIGTVYTSVAIGTLFGPSAAGFVYDATQSYPLPILGGAIANVVAEFVMAAATRPVPSTA